MEDISEITREPYIKNFYIDICCNKSIYDFEDRFKNNDIINYYSNLIHPEFRDFDVLSVDRIAQIFFDNEEKIEHIFSSNKLKNYERLLCFKDQTESKLISHLIDVKVAVEILYEKFQNAVRMRADVTEVKGLLKSIGKFQSSIHDKNICDNCSSKTSISCYIEVLLSQHDIIISEKQVLDSEILLETVKLLLQAGGKVNDYCDDSGSPPLMSAILKLNTELALFLLENRAHVNFINTEDQRFQPLFWAVGFSESISLVEKIIEKGADLNARNGDFGSTALHIACTYGNENAIELLIIKGADITLKDFEGVTPLASLIYNNDIAHILSLKMLFVKEIAKAEFENRYVPLEDLEKIRKDPYLNELHKKCRDQLDKLKSTIFYPTFSYIDLLNMRNKNARKLVKLLRNGNFIRKMAGNLSLDSLYNKDLMINFAEAEIIRRKYDQLESILKSTIGKRVSTDLIMYIMDFIEVQDLSLFTDREF